MSTFPEILKDNYHPTTILRRQGPFFSLKIENSTRKIPSFSLQRNTPTDTLRTRLKVNRYSIQKNQRQSSKSVMYSTISYNHLDDPQFYGTKGKKDQVQSLQVLMTEKQKDADIVGLKVASIRGVNEEYLKQLRELHRRTTKDINEVEVQLFRQIKRLKNLLSQLRRQTKQQQKWSKLQLKQFNDELIDYCESMNKLDNKYKTCKTSLQKV